MGRGKGGALFSFLPSLPTTQRGLCGGERRDALVLFADKRYYTKVGYSSKFQLPKSFPILV